METGARVQVHKMIEITRTHCSITAVAFSHKYRLYLIVTSGFDFIFMNENGYTVATEFMNGLSTVNFVHFNDKQNQLITAGIKGVYIHNFKYSGKYEDPKLAATIDIQGKHIKVDFVKKRLLEPSLFWIKGMKVD